MSVQKAFLLVEDDDDDIVVFRRVLRKAKIANALSVVTDGRQAVDYLSGIGKYSDREDYPLPFLIFLDIKLPYLDGFEVLRWIKTRAEFASIVVVVMSSSDEDRDHKEAYELGARSYLVKPPSVTQIIAVLKSLGPYWEGSGSGGPVEFA